MPTELAERIVPAGVVDEGVTEVERRLPVGLLFVLLLLLILLSWEP